MHTKTISKNVIIHLMAQGTHAFKNHTHYSIFLLLFLSAMYFYAKRMTILRLRQRSLTALPIGRACAHPLPVHDAGPGDGFGYLGDRVLYSLEGFCLINPDGLGGSFSVAYGYCYGWMGVSRVMEHLCRNKQLFFLSDAVKTIHTFAKIIGDGSRDKSRLVPTSIFRVHFDAHWDKSRLVPTTPSIPGTHPSTAPCCL